MRPSLDHLAQAFDMHSQRGDTPAWLSTMQHQAWEQVKASGLPWRKDEHWKYTSLYDLAKIEFTAAHRHTNEKHDTQAALGDLQIFSARQATSLQMVNGHLLPSSESLPAGVSVSTLDSAEGLTNELPRASVLATLNHAFTQQAIELKIERNYDTELPLYLHHHTDGDKTLSSPRVKVIVADNVHASLVEHYTGSGTLTATNSRLDIELGCNARLRHTRVQTDCRDAHQFHNAHVQGSADSHYRSLVLDLGAKMARSDLSVSLNGKGAECELLGVFLPEHHQHFDHHTLTLHNVGLTHSDQNYHGVAGARGRGVFNGKVHVKPDAQKIVALQSNDNILLTENAEIDTKPELEIYADDVKCSHGATVGQLDETSLFYLQSRGLARKDARHLLIKGFIRDIYRDTGNDTLKEFLDEQIQNKLTTLVDQLP